MNHKLFKAFEEGTKNDRRLKIMKFLMPISTIVCLGFGTISYYRNTFDNPSKLVFLIGLVLSVIIYEARPSYTRHVNFWIEFSNVVADGPKWGLRLRANSWITFAIWTYVFPYQNICITLTVILFILWFLGRFIFRPTR